MKILREDSRNQLISKSRKSPKGRQRYNRRLKSSISSSVREYNQIDMNKLFKDNILTVAIPVRGETDDYVVRISFGGFCDILHDELERNGNKLDLRSVLRALMIGFNKEDVYIGCSCLHPETRIKLLDGTEPTVEELKNRYDSGEKLYVYSTDENGDFKPGEVEKVWITKEGVSEFIKVTLDNGEEILTTPDHKYMLRTGEYTQAEDLTPGTSLMPLYFSSANGYETVKKNSTGRYHSVYKQVAETLKSCEIAEAQQRAELDDSARFTYRVAIHHKDFNKRNNSPENLQPMTACEHWYYHAKLCGPDRVVTDRAREISRMNAYKRNANPTPAMIEARRIWNERGRLRNYDPDRKEQQAALMGRVVRNYWENISEDDRNKFSEKASKRMKNCWETGCFDTEKFHEARLREGHRLLSNPEHQKKMLYGRPKKVLEYLVANNIELTEENYEKYKRRTDPHITTLFDSFEEAIRYYKLNHRVISVERVKIEPVSVYDIQVKDYHNFLVNSSVIVHNCEDFFYRYGYYATKNNISSLAPQNIPSDITNPDDSLGSGCKHILLVLSNTKWIIKVASVIRNYINYAEEHLQRAYAEVIYPAIYKKKYEKPYQPGLFDKDEIDTDQETIDVSNKAAQERGRFKPGNQQGVQFAPNEKDSEQDEFELEG